MTIERERATYDTVIECDRVGCSATFTISSCIDFNSGWTDAKKQGWRAKRIGVDWVHGCPLHADEI